MNHASPIRAHSEGDHRPSHTIDMERHSERMADFGFRLAADEEVGATLELATRLLNQELAPVETVRRFHRHAGGAVWVLADDEIKGFILSLLLTGLGEAALRQGHFTPSDPDPAHICRPGEAAYGVYCWVYGGVDRDARRAVMTASAVLRVEMLPMLPTFARGATEDGARSAHSLGMVPVADSLPDLFVQEPLTQFEGAA